MDCFFPTVGLARCLCILVTLLVSPALQARYCAPPLREFPTLAHSKSGVGVGCVGSGDGTGINASREGGSGPICSGMGSGVGGEVAEHRGSEYEAGTESEGWFEATVREWVGRARWVTHLVSCASKTRV